MSTTIKFDTKKLEKDLNKMVQNVNNEISIKREVESRHGNMKVLKKTEKELLSILISKENNYTCTITYRQLPSYISTQLNDLLTTLKYAGYVANFSQWLGGSHVTLTPEGLSYLEMENEYIKNNTTPNVSIGTLNASESSIIFGTVYDSNFNIDNSYQKVESMIEEKGKEDKEELKQILNEVKDYIDNINESKVVSKNSGLFERIGNHIEKHQWFYQCIVNMLGNAIIAKMSGN